MNLWQSLHPNGEDLDFEFLNIRMVHKGSKCIKKTTSVLPFDATRLRAYQKTKVNIAFHFPYASTYI